MLSDNGLIECPGCGWMVPSGLAACWRCGGILDLNLKKIASGREGGRIFVLTATQKKIMKALKSGGRATAVQLSDRMNISARRVIPSLVGLKKKGLVSRGVSDQGNIWSPTESVVST